MVVFGISDSVYFLTRACITIGRCSLSQPRGCGLSLVTINIFIYFDNWILVWSFSSKSSARMSGRSNRLPLLKKVLHVNCSLFIFLARISLGYHLSLFLALYSIKMWQRISFSRRSNLVYILLQTANRWDNALTRIVMMYSFYDFFVLCCPMNSSLIPLNSTSYCILICFAELLSNWCLNLLTLT